MQRMQYKSLHYIVSPLSVLYKKHSHIRVLEERRKHGDSQSGLIPGTLEWDKLKNVHMTTYSDGCRAAGQLLSVHVSQKSTHRQSTLQVCRREGCGYSWFRVFPHLTMKKCPCHVYSGSMPSKWTIGQTVTHNGTRCSFKVESWQHTRLWTVPCHHEHGVPRSVCRIS